MKTEEEVTFLLPELGELLLHIRRGVIARGKFPGFIRPLNTGKQWTARVQETQLRIFRDIYNIGPAYCLIAIASDCLSIGRSSQKSIAKPFSLVSI